MDQSEEYLIAGEASSKVEVKTGPTLEVVSNLPLRQVLMSTHVVVVMMIQSMSRTHRRVAEPGGFDLYGQFVNTFRLVIDRRVGALFLPWLHGIDRHTIVCSLLLGNPSTSYSTACSWFAPSPNIYRASPSSTFTARSSVAYRHGRATSASLITRTAVYAVIRSLRAVDPDASPVERQTHVVPLHASAWSP